MAGWVWQSFGTFEHSLRKGLPVFDQVFGAPLFHYYAAHPDAASASAEGLKSVGRGQDAAIVATYDFTRAGTVVDVGGGQGGLLAAILAANPQAHGVLLDLPHVAAMAGQSVEAVYHGGRCQRWRCASRLHLQQRLETLGGSTSSHRDIGVDCRSAQMPVEDCLRGLELDALVRAVQQLATPLYSARRQLSQRSFDCVLHAGPAARIGAATWQASVRARRVLRCSLLCSVRSHSSPRRHEHVTRSQSTARMPYDGSRWCKAIAASAFRHFSEFFEQRYN